MFILIHSSEWRDGETDVELAKKLVMMIKKRRTENTIDISHIRRFFVCELALLFTNYNIIISDQPHTILVI